MRFVAQFLIATSLLATIASTLKIYPHQLAYFNEAAGGPENAHQHLLHSNVDWGQDLLYLKQFLDAHPEIESAQFDIIPPVRALTLFWGVENDMNSSWFVVPVTQLVSRSDSNLVLDGYETDERVGYSLYVLRSVGNVRYPGISPSRNRTRLVRGTVHEKAEKP